MNLPAKIVGTVLGMAALYAFFEITSRKRPLPDLSAYEDGLLEPLDEISRGTTVSMVLVFGAFLFDWIKNGGFLNGVAAALMGSGILVAIYSWIRYKPVYHEFSDEGINHMSGTGKTCEFAWEDIERIEYVRQFFRITLKSGEAVQIRSIMRGIPEFAEMVLAKIPAARINAKTEKALRRAAASTGEDAAEPRAQLPER